MLGGYVGDQTEYLGVPCADVGPIKVPQGLSDEQVLFLSDIFPTGFMASDFCNLKGGETTSQSPEIFQKPRYIRGSQRRSGPHFFALSLMRPFFTPCGPSKSMFEKRADIRMAILAPH
jgi:hypothetical protein